MGSRFIKCFDQCAANLDVQQETLSSCMASSHLHLPDLQLTIPKQCLPHFAMVIFLNPVVSR